jgi:transcriptional regulator with GAF, ATPase, and Fis domain/pSer/pThr/pTyr-binding forkhead associated (FHA) protein
MRSDTSIPSGQPRLVAIAGPRSGEVLPVSAPELTIGRDPSNGLCLADLSLSRRHCAITLEGAPRIRDLQSSNGTFVNGMQISDHLLTDGDRIQLGESLFLFISEASAAPAVPVTLSSAEPGAATVRLRLDDVTYLRGDEPRAALHATRKEQHLQALLTIATAMNTARKEEEILELLLDVLAASVPAGQLSILGAVTGDTAPLARACRPQPETRLQVNSAVLRQALEEKTAVLTTDGPSVLCAPLLARGRALGAIYLTASGAKAFDQEHLQLTAAIAAIAAVAIDNAQHLAALEQEAARIQSDPALDHNLVGRGPKMARVFELVGKVARTDSTVLIAGETGTGKELVARAIHRNSPRAKRPFVAINCAALTETLRETELFGHERGAFTNAVALKRGKLELAHGGTVFLDEVGELALGLQSKLLRVLQEHEFERVGGTRSIHVDVRLISATNRNLAEEVAARRFREDLFHRLNVIAIETPPLRERREDIPLLAEHFVARFAQKSNRRVRGIAPATQTYLMTYDWPGNVRELENTIERAIVLGSSEEIRPEDLPESLLEGKAAASVEGGLLHYAVREAKTRVIRDAFRQARRSYTQAAHLLGVHPNYLHRLIRNLGLKSDLEEDT